MPATPKSAMRTRQQDKARQQRQDAKARKACRDAVWKRANHHCENCTVYVYRPGSWAPWTFWGHVHEIRARSLGGNHNDPDQCLLLCPDCHMPNGAHRRSERASV